MPIGTSFPVVSPDEFTGEVQVAVTEMDWDATAEVAEANEYNDAPGSGEKYMLTTMEAAFHGEGTLSTTFWVSVTYVAEDGAEYGNSYAITPLALPAALGGLRRDILLPADRLPDPAGRPRGRTHRALPDLRRGSRHGHLGDCGLTSPDRSDRGGHRPAP